MSEKLFKTIIPEDIIHYVESSKSCKFTFSSCEIEGKLGSIEIDLGQTFNAVTIKFRRNSGNGQIVLLYKDTRLEQTVLSKIEQSVTISNLSSFKIERGSSSSGIVELLSINLYTSEKNTIMHDWKDILARCNSYKCIRVSNGKLHASEGAIIISDGINSVSTSPPNMFKIEDKTIKFLGACEIIELNISGDKKISVNLYPHLGSNPQPILLQQETFNNLLNNSNQNSQQQEISDNLIYNSPANSLFKLNSIKNASFNGKSIIFGHKGSVSVPISAIQPNSDYIVIIEASKINGNGKISAHIEPSQDQEHQVLFTSAIHRAINFKIRSGPSTFIEGAFKLVVDRPESALGEIAISRVSLIKDIPSMKQIPLKDIDFQKYNPRISELNLIKNPIQLNKLAPVASDVIDLQKGKDRKFVIVIPSYNNEKWVEKNISSALNQNYSNFRVIYLDDHSSDRTFEKAKAYIGMYNGNLKTTLIRNSSRVGALENLYNAIHSCANDEIILTLDGDDWLSNENVLNILNNVYKNENVWMTYGQYRNSHDGNVGISQPIPQGIINSNSFRNYPWCSSHLRSFYAGLFKKINRNDMVDGNKFYQMAWDMTLMFPMLEMSANHSKYVGDILYIYNMQNPLSDHVIDRKLQMSLDGVMRAKAKYQPIVFENSKLQPEQKINVGLIIIATGKYHSFVAPLINSADRYFLNNDKYNISYFIFSDGRHDLLTHRNVKQININHVPFPYATMNRYKYFTENKSEFDSMDYLYYVDVDCLFVDNINDEIIGDLVAVRHCGYWNGGGSFEDNNKSVHYLEQSKYKHYYGGGWQGGSKDQYLAMAQWCYEHIEQDLSNNIIPKWHDETSLNTYLASQKEPTIILNPNYHYPQNYENFKPFWGGNDFQPKILLLEKYHEKARE